MVARLGYRLMPLALFMLMTVPVVTFADVAVIANKNIAKDSVTAAVVKKIFLAKIKTLTGGGKVKLGDLPHGNPVRVEFYGTVVKKKERQLKAYWAKKAFTGKAFPPRNFDTEAELLIWVAETPGAVGYVSIGAVNDSVKVLFKK